MFPGKDLLDLVRADQAVKDQQDIRDAKVPKGWEAADWENLLLSRRMLQDLVDLYNDSPVLAYGAASELELVEVPELWVDSPPDIPKRARQLLDLIETVKLFLEKTDLEKLRAKKAKEKVCHC